MLQPSSSAIGSSVSACSENGVRLAHAFLWEYSYKRLKLA
jgi:hypothetical protein